MDFNKLNFKTGTCNICCLENKFYHTTELIIREELFCSNCKSPRRYRSLARGLLFALEDFFEFSVQWLNEFSKKITPQNNKINVFDNQIPFNYTNCS
jgi:hypothetical protein